MKTSVRGFRVAVIGASSLLGKELLAVLEERKFPVSRLVTPGKLEDDTPDLPVLDLGGSLEAAMSEGDVGETDLDLVFVAGPVGEPSKKGSSTPSGDASFLHSTERLAAATQSRVIDLCGALAGEAGGELSVPFLDRDRTSGAGATPRFRTSAHAATMVIGAILLRLAAKFPAKNAVAQVYQPVSEISAQAIDELQKQTLNLLSFQKIPQAVFGAQLAFNLLPRLGQHRGKNIKASSEHLQRELGALLGPAVPVPALRVILAPVFHSLSCMLYFQSVPPASIGELTQALHGDPFVFRSIDEAPPTQVDVSGSSEIVLDVLAPDGIQPGGVWIWAVADNLRLSAVNAVEIAESLAKEIETEPSRKPTASGAAQS